MCLDSLGQIKVILECPNRIDRSATKQLQILSIGLVAPKSRRRTHGSIYNYTRHRWVIGSYVNSNVAMLAML